MLKKPLQIRLQRLFLFFSCPIGRKARVSGCRGARACPARCAVPKAQALKPRKTRPRAADHRRRGGTPKKKF
jgi:hypothetical protein